MTSGTQPQLKGRDDVLALASREATLERAGGKGANLSELARGGFPVPPGFIVTTDAYREFVQANGLQPRILALARDGSPGDPQALEEISDQIRALFVQGTLPDEIREAIRSAYLELSEGGGEGEGEGEEGGPSPAAVAVRSSATAEDLPGMAFAGQQDTYLNVIGAAEVLDAVKKCWGSLWTARAMAYRDRGHVSPEEVALAVVVQQMIPSESSGVLFTANPLTGRRDEMVIDASFGLGEAIVSGQVEPDHYVVRSRDGSIAKVKLGAKELAIVARPEGGTARVERSAAQGGESALAPVLAEAQIVELARMAGRVAERFGTPQDIEWAWANGQFYLLQSRPIASLYPLPVNPGPDDNLRVYFSFNAVQGLTDPISPLGRDALANMLSGAVRHLPIERPAREYIPAAGGRLFIDVTGLATDPRLRQILLAVLARGDPAARETVLDLVAHDRIPTKKPFGRRRLLALLLRVRTLIGRLLAALIAPEKARASLDAGVERIYRRAEEHARAATDLQALLAAMDADLRDALQQVLILFAPRFLPAFASITIIDRWLVEWLREKPGAALGLLRSVVGNVTTEMDLYLWSIAQEIRSDPAARKTMSEQPVEQLRQDFRNGLLPPIAQQGLARFLERYGMRAIAEIDIYRPRWRDDPSSILQTLKSYLQLEDPALAPSVVFERGAAEAKRLALDYQARLRHERFGFMRARLLGAAIRRMRVLGGARELPKFYLIKILDAYRTALLRQGQALAERGILPTADDIFFVPFDSLRELANGEAGGKTVDIRGIASRERSEYEREKSRKQMPHLLLSTGEAFYEGMGGAEAGVDVLVGDPVSPGVVEGSVHVVFDPRQARLEPGEILVCPATDPGWTPLFLTAGGLVMEIGGMMTHGSVVAREYGIPAVVGVHNATSRLKTGERVRVDGNRGKVSRLTGEEKKAN